MQGGLEKRKRHFKHVTLPSFYGSRTVPFTLNIATQLLKGLFTGLVILDPFREAGGAVRTSSGGLPGSGGALHDNWNEPLDSTGDCATTA